MTGVSHTIDVGQISFKYEEDHVCKEIILNGSERIM